MNISVEFESQAQVDTDKLYKILESCKTREQLQCAYNYYELWWKKYEKYIKSFIETQFYHRHRHAVLIYNKTMKKIQDDERRVY